MKTRVILFALISAVVLFAASCGNKKKNATGQEETEIIPGKVYDNITCKNDVTVSYALYLPKSYDTSKRYPIVFAFDAHAKGIQPVDTFKNVAEEFGYIIVGSNNSKNGIAWDATSAMYDVFYSDVISRFAVDKARIYTAGFSGGSRVASTIAIMKGGIYSVVGCSGGFPNINEPIKNKFDYCGIAGVLDMNFIEMLTLNKQLDNSSMRHEFLTFTGKHEWPPKRTVEEAFLWLELNAMRDNKKPVNKEFVNKEFQLFEIKKKEIEKKNNLYLLYQHYLKTINYFDGLIDLAEIKAKVKGLENTPTIKNGLKNETIAINKELFLQKKYSEYFSSKDIKWWKTEVANLEGFIKKSSKQEDKNMVVRLLEYLSLVSYSNSNALISQNRFKEAEKFIEIYTIVDPDNSEAFYLQAFMAAKNNKTEKAIISLQRSAELGFSDFNRMERDTVIGKLKNNPKYASVIEMMKKNNK
jgi:poly(3-hydroxybutyrate) depolymerase